MRLIRDGEKGEGSMEVEGGGGGRLYTYRYSVTSQNDLRSKKGSDESHFKVSVGSDGQSHRTVSTNHNLSEEEGEPKR